KIPEVGASADIANVFDVGGRNAAQGLDVLTQTDPEGLGIVEGRPVAQGAGALENGLVEQVGGKWGRHQGREKAGARRESPDGDAFRIASKGVDVVLDPAQGFD